MLFYYFLEIRPVPLTSIAENKSHIWRSLHALLFLANFLISSYIALIISTSFSNSLPNEQIESYEYVLLPFSFPLFNYTRLTFLTKAWENFFLVLGKMKSRNLQTHKLQYHLLFVANFALTLFIHELDYEFAFTVCYFRFQDVTFLEEAK